MSEYYFPNQPVIALNHEGRLRAVVASLPEPTRLELYSILSAAVQSFATTSFRMEDGMNVACQEGREIAFPVPVPLIKLSHIIFGYEEWLARKYSLPGFVEVESGDIVVDCGSYVGGFAIGAAELASEVHAFEPDEANARCARRNLAEFANVRIMECGLYDRSDEMTLNLSASSVEHSLLLPDDGVITGTRPIRVVSLADYARDNGIERYDFVKIEAEGVELEVFAGLGNLRPRKLAIDVSPERNGESPAEEFRSRLGPMGYEVEQRGHVMFARLSQPTVQVQDNAESAKLPRTIYSLWLQGIENAPAIVRLNFERWRRLNPGYRLEILDHAAVIQMLGHLPMGLDQIAPQALSDIVRAHFLSKNGGVWVDASVFPTRPLDEWLPSLMATSGFFAFERPGPDRPISSWFLAANAGNRMMRAWSEQVLKYWSLPRAFREGIPDDPVEAVTAWPDTYPYFWFHYLFQALVDRDPVFAADWAQCAKVSADLPHLMQGRLGQDPQLPFDELKAIASMAPVHKLNWRAEYPIERLSELA